jgi:hypothetical protein
VSERDGGQRFGVDGAGGTTASDTGLVTEPGQPTPQRIGDAERDRAAELLREHLALGRLDRDEFEERVGRALSARTLDQLTPLFEDLPGPKPGQELTPTYQAPPWQGPPAQSRDLTPGMPAGAATPTAPNHTWRVIAAVSWPLTLLVLFSTGWHYWWLIFIPVALGSMAGKAGRARGGH